MMYGLKRNTLTDSQREIKNTTKVKMVNTIRDEKYLVLCKSGILVVAIICVNNVRLLHRRNEQIFKTNTKTNMKI